MFSVQVYVPPPSPQRVQQLRFIREIPFHMLTLHIGTLKGGFFQQAERATDVWHAFRELIICNYAP